VCFGFSGLGYIVGSKVAEALNSWQWALRVSSVNILWIIIAIREFLCRLGILAF